MIRCGGGLKWIGEARRSKDVRAHASSMVIWEMTERPAYTLGNAELDVPTGSERQQTFSETDA